jgi:hypothetical protein
VKNLAMVAGLISSILLGTGDAQAPTGGWLAINPGKLCVTEGTIDKTAGGHLSVNVPKMRAYINAWTSQAIEVRFTYLGPTSGELPLGSGEMRRQFGLKLHAQDPCNLIYVMWRIGPGSKMPESKPPESKLPESKLVVSVKRNPGAHTSAECGNHGYENVKPSSVSEVPRLKPGESHTLRAEMKTEELKVFVDDHEAWRGDVGTDAASLHGPVGIRSDNAHLEFELQAGEYEGVHPNFLRACQSGAANSD